MTQNKMVQPGTRQHQPLPPKIEDIMSIDPYKIEDILEKENYRQRKINISL
jgi:hypothetical protein